MVEKVAGRRFTQPLKIEKFGSDEQLEHMTREFEWIYGEIMPDAPESTRSRMARTAAVGLSRGALGKYGIFEKVVYLNEPGMELAMASAGIAEEDEDDAIALIVAHEIGHALEDQVVDLKETVEELHDAEQLEAASATWEGLATWIEGEVARELGAEDVFWKLNGLQGWSDDGLIELEGWSTWATYGQGYRFVGHHHRAGGADQMWAILEDPPASTAQIWRPDDYDPTVPEPPRDYTGILRGVEQKLTKGEWLVANTRLGETTLRGEAVADPDGLEALERAMSHLRWAHQLDLSREDRGGEVRILEFDSPEAARRWLELLRAQRTAVNAHAAAVSGTPIEVITEPFPDVPGDDAVLRIERIPIGNGRHIERHQAWVVRGPFAVVVTAERFRPGLRLGWTVEEVFTRLEAASSAD